VGPYDTVTLKATDPSALENWLNANGYALPDTFRPTVAAYVAGGFDFIALRLQPGQGVQAMKPVRVVTQVADVLLPLRMVAAGVGAQVGITLYVISEGRYEAASPFFNATVDDSQLTWSASQNRSNYQELSQQLMQGHSGHTWLTEFSGSVSLVPSSINEPCGAGGGPYFGGQSLADLYLSQCPCGGPSSCSTPLGVLTTPLDGAAESSADAAGEPGLPSDSGDMGDTGEVDGSESVEGGDATSAPDVAAYDSAGPAPDAACVAFTTCTSDFDDLDVAMVGLHPSDTWVTRLRAILAVNALAEGDLQIQATSPQTPVSNIHNANVYDDPSYSPCGSKGGCSASAEDQSPFGRWLVAGTFVFAVAALVRRRARRA
jgi:MYXO-CTERM domain-containing protein